MINIYHSDDVILQIQIRHLGNIAVCIKTQFSNKSRYAIFLKTHKHVSVYYLLQDMHYLGPSHKGGAFLGLYSYLRITSLKIPWHMGIWCVYVLWFSCLLAHWRGRQNFCLQKSRMPLAGLVYFNTLIFSVHSWVGGMIGS